VGQTAPITYDADPSHTDQDPLSSGSLRHLVGLAFYAVCVLLMLLVAYWVIRVAVRHGVMDANARADDVPSDHADPLPTS
jgi:hypothetical protein